MEVIKAFEAQHPNIKVEYKTYRAEDLSTILPLQFESGDTPADVIAMWGWFIAEMDKKGHLME
ncbi:putative trehalose ABC transporter, substrate-binding component, Archaea-type [Thermococcus sp. 2319x1]|nr:putative trehalose ABC transporter, substrate-binding component, Archaea-type [Thermococcus sp. 2319x1]